MASLICKQCNHENESERVYCHNCGTKLDRSLLPDDSKKQDAPKAQKRRVKKLTSPARGFFVGWFGSLVTTLVWSSLVASLYQMTRWPDGVPPMPKKGGVVETPQLIMAIEDAKSLRSPQLLAFDTNTVNSYLAGALRAKDAGPLSDYVKFDRAYVALDEGDFRMTAQQSAFNFPLFAAVDYSLAIAGDKVSATILAGRIGRLPVHPAIMGYADVIFQKVWDALRREHKLVDGMQSIAVHQNQIVMMTKPAPR